MLSLFLANLNTKYMKTIIEFHLIKLAEDSYIIDPNSFAMNGKMGWNYLEEFLWKETDWYADVWADEKNEKLDDCCRQVTMEVWLDSDDYKSWLDFKVLDEFPIAKNNGA